MTRPVYSELQPTRTLASTVISNLLLNSSPSTCMNQVVVQLSTSVLIPDYHRFYDTPVNDFQGPTYIPLADGSLITSVLVSDLRSAKLTLLVTGVLTMLFARNIFVSGDYLRRAKLKKKTLFRVLFVSQLLAVVAFIPDIMSEFNAFVDCKVVNILSCVSTAISVALLITWILGYKAYKCLNNSRFVLVSLALFMVSSIVIHVLELITLQAERRLSGSCIRKDNIFTHIYIILQLAQSFFICCCFCHAVWKSRGSPVARGRISIRLSTDSYDEHHPDDVPNNGRRGWWDYVPKTDVPPSNNGGFMTSFMDRISNNKDIDSSQSRPLRKSSVTDEFPSPEPSRPSVVRISTATQGNPEPTGRSSPTPSSHSRLSRYMPRMELFRLVMRDELCYITFITASCVVVAVLSLIGVNFRNGLTVSGWLSMNWAVISALAIHSFGRVIRRHERDATLQEPRSWQARRMPFDNARRARQAASLTNTGASSHGMTWQKESHLQETWDPFSDPGKLNPIRTSWNSVSSYGVETSPLDEKRWSPILPLPPIGEDYRRPPHDSGDGTLIQGSRSSWQNLPASSISPGFTLVDDKSSHRGSVS
ncbi:hypothetical protein C8J56DRAFT_919412 [Mycena floridula]|nr:hypothetical protein C8J56DRAFT_919412 [Mycena floridula]